MERMRQKDVSALSCFIGKTMVHSEKEMMAHLANDLFRKRQRFIKASQAQAGTDAFDERSLKALEAEYKMAEAEYLEAKATFARAMKTAARDG